MRPLKNNSRGSVTLVALCLAVVIGIALGSYIALCHQSLQFSTRTVQLSRARQMAESGLEEALWALNNKNWTATPWGAPFDADSDGFADDREIVISGLSWGEGVTGITKLTVANFDGPSTSPAIPNPIITVSATVTAPGLGAFTKTLTATTKPAPLFVNALGITNPQTNPTVGSNTYAVIFNNGGLVDSWDSDYLGYAPVGFLPNTTPVTPNRDFNSTTPYPGTNPGTIPSPQNPYPITAPSTYPDISFNYAAVVAAPNIRLNNAEIRGYAMTFGNSVSTNSNSKIQGPSPLATPPNLDPSRVGKSAFVPIFSVAAPSGAAFGTLDGSTTTVDNSGSSAPRIMDASSTNLTINNNTITIKGHVIIRVPGDLDLIFGGKIIVYDPVIPGPETGRLEIFVGGNIRIGGATSSVAGFVNNTNEPKRLALYSTSTSPSRTFQYYTTLPYCGVMYSAAPSNAKIDFQATNPTILGAIVANSNIEFSGTPTIHYDSALQYLPKNWFRGVTTPFIIVQVTESITP